MAWSFKVVLAGDSLIENFSNKSRSRAEDGSTVKESEINQHGTSDLGGVLVWDIAKNCPGLSTNLQSSLSHDGSHHVHKAPVSVGMCEPRECRPCKLKKV